MKRNKYLVLVVLLLAPFVGAKAQTNMQLHYNFGRNIYEERNVDTGVFVTLEHYSSDRWGNNFFFTDLSFGTPNMTEAYVELHRNLRFWDLPLHLHFSYKGGLNQYVPFPHTYLAGLNYSHYNPKKDLSLCLTIAYRHDQKQPRPHNMHLNGTWGWTSWNRLWTLSGFWSFWTTSNDFSDSRVAFIAEPQIWLNLNQFVGVPDAFNLSLGSELKLYYNFYAPDKFYAMPTIAMKWTFK